MLPSRQYVQLKLETHHDQKVAAPQIHRFGRGEGNGGRSSFEPERDVRERAGSFCVSP